MTVRVPVALMDHPPTGAEADYFTYHPADEWNEQLVPIDVPAARNVLRAALRASERLVTLPWVP